jgi:NADH-quinone oxidoreductase subunit F
MGISFRKLLDEYCGGMRQGSTLKAIIPGGASSAIITAEEADWASDFDTLKSKKTMAGSGAVVYLDQSVNMAQALANIMRFFAHESCGQCTPCREGTAWLSRLLDKIVAGKGEKTDVDNVHQIARQMEMKTICALADGAAMPAKSYIEKFRADFDALVRG